MRRLFPLLFAGLIALSVAGEIALQRTRRARMPSLAEGTYAALGGLRSIAAEIAWFRADRLQEEGRYVELAQLAGVLTAMEPHTPEVWSYASWNLAYNVSVMMPTAEDRWRWVYAAIRLLRDDGLRLNPGDPELSRDLAWLFELKIGAKLDSASDTYRRLWREMVEDVSARDAWSELGMTAEHMREVERETGFSDWTNPFLSAIYWASNGLGQAKGNDLALLREIIRQSGIIYLKNRTENDTSTQNERNLVK